MPALTPIPDKGLSGRGRVRGGEGGECVALAPRQATNSLAMLVNLLIPEFDLIFKRIHGSEF